MTVPKACAPFFHSVKHKPVSIYFHTIENILGVFHSVKHKPVSIRLAKEEEEEEEEEEDEEDDDDDSGQKQVDPRGVRPVVHA